MGTNPDQAAAFGILLRQNPQASRFFDSCTPTQKEAIMAQLPQLTSQAQLKGFVEHLPSAAL